MFWTHLISLITTDLKSENRRNSRGNPRSVGLQTVVNKNTIQTPFPTNPSAEVADGILESCAVTAELYPAKRYWADSI